MFVVSTLSDSHVRVLPENLGKPRVEALSDALEEIYVEKVFPDLGMIISLHEILDIEGGTVYQLDGAATFSVKFSLVVFRPFVGEILTGKLIKCDDQGLKVSLGFFDDITIPEHALQDPSTFDTKENLWVWKVDDNEAFMDLGEEVRFRVAAIRFPEEPTAASMLEQKDEDPEENGASKLGPKTFAPLVIEGDINADGLGCVSWWQ